MGELNVGNLFDTAYDALAKGVKLTGYAGGEPWTKLVPELRKAVGTSHFNDGSVQALDDLRKAAKPPTGKGGSEGAILAAASGITAINGATLVGGDTAQRCAALKTLRHTYFLRRRGAHQLWIVSLPKSYSAWPDRYFGAQLNEVVKRLSETDEQFDVDAREHLSDATQHALQWVQKALILLDNTRPDSRGLRVLKRWFADEDTTETQTQAFAATLKAGLKKIVPKLSGGSLIICDFVPIRHSADATDASFLRANAFVWADKRDVIYIEPPFFKRAAANVFHSDMSHWTRIVVHELTHREVKTLDKRYGWAGVKPKKGSFPAADAMVNADSWALFVADAAGAMTKGARYRGLHGA